MISRNPQAPIFKGSSERPSLDDGFGPEFRANLVGCAFRLHRFARGGIKLFESDERFLSSRLSQTKDKLALLPKSVRKKPKVVRDDF